MTRRAERLGRKMRFGMNPFVALGPDEEAAIDATIDRILQYDPEPDVRKLKRRMLPNTRAGCMGPPEKVRKQMQRFQDLGLDLDSLQDDPDFGKYFAYRRGNRHADAFTRAGVN